MQPVQITGTYPLNAWYAVGTDVEIGRHLLARTVCDIPMVLYRRFDRVPVALEDACWHRLLPLSAGKLRGDELECGYHGLVYNPQGQCTHAPGQDKVPSKACVRAFPVVERYRLVWVWPGDPEKADPALLPDLHWADDEEWAGEHSLIEMACDYRLVLDNLMDLSHETFVHTTSLGQQAVVESPFTVTHEGARVKLERWMIDVDGPPWLDMQLKLARGLAKTPKIDRWQIIHFEAPSTIVIDVGVAPTGSGARQGDRSKGVTGSVLNTVTPESHGRCHYFFQYSRSFALDDRGLTADMKEAIFRIFMEDKDVLEQQQRSMERMPNRRLVDLATDAGSLWARRAITAMVAAEREGATGGPDGAPAIQRAAANV
jgi:phenylpropionate dioxygenase-like ring-hydroxylating dioxygenase large terminal subunit